MNSSQRGLFQAGPAAILLVFLITAALAASALLQGAEVQHQIMKSFGRADQMGRSPVGLSVGADGTIYGVAYAGGATGAGAVFAIGKDGTGYQVLHHFDTNGFDGQKPTAAPLEGSDRTLYGTTTAGGNSGNGTVFKLNRDGSGYQVLHHFSGNAQDGGGPAAQLVEGHDGFLYGTTTNSNWGCVGTIFKLKKDGSGYRVLGRFAWDGTMPGGLLAGSDDALYGTTQPADLSTTGTKGTVFKLNTNGSGFRILHRFEATGDGAGPVGALVEGSDGALYGTTFSGGTHTEMRTSGNGIVFKLNKDGTGYQVLHDFRDAGWPDGAQPQGRLLAASDGALYGTCSIGGSNSLGGTVFRLNTDGTGYGVLRHFIAWGTDGFQPSAGMIEGKDGLLYGATPYGGSFGNGTVFRMSKDGSAYELVRSFYGDHIAGDGGGPQAELTLATDGALYGTTTGGSNDLGTIFRINQDGSGYSVLHWFGWRADDGQRPAMGLVVDDAGTLFGTAAYGGGGGLGVIFRLDTQRGEYGVLHHFGFTADDGAVVAGRLLMDSGGLLYGTTATGGKTGGGTVFVLNKNGAGYALLHGFNGDDGWGPRAGLIEGSDGFLYGTTSGDNTNNSGTVFRLTKDGTSCSLLHRFGTDGAEGAAPQAPLLEASDGVLYGTTAYGGSNGLGTVFGLNKDGSVCRVLHHFGGRSGIEGRHPLGALIEGPDGALYGTTAQGGGSGAGTVFTLNKDGSGYQTILSLGGTRNDGRTSCAALVMGQGGILYGTTFSGGDLDSGAIFRLTPGVLSTQVLPPGVQWEFDTRHGPPLWNISGSYSLPVTGNEGAQITVSLHQDAAGRIKDENGYVGSVRTTSTGASVRFSHRYEDTSSLGWFSFTFDWLRRRDSLTLSLEPGTGTLTGTDTLYERMDQVTDFIWRTVTPQWTYSTVLPVSFALPQGTEGRWQLNLRPTLSGKKVSGTATITFPNGELFNFNITGSYSPATQTTKLILAGTGSDRGASLIVSFAGPDQQFKSLVGTAGGQRIRFP